MHQTELFEVWNVLKEKHGLSDWTIKVNSNRTFLGWCKYRYKRIEISINHLNSGNRKEILNTLLHEIAHALVGPHHGHNEVWRRKAIEIGCDGNRCGRIESEFSYQAICNGCQKKFHRHRQVRANQWKYCLACGPVNGRLVYCPINRTNPFTKNEIVFSATGAKNMLTSPVTSGKLSSVSNDADGGDGKGKGQNRNRERNRIRKAKTMTPELKAAIDAKQVILTKEEKTQGTRGKGSRKLTYSWDNVDFQTVEGALAYFTGLTKTVDGEPDADGKVTKKVVAIEPEQAILEALSDYASEKNQQDAWEALFELSDVDKQIRAAAKKLVGLLPGIDSIEKAEEFVRAQIEAAAK